MTDTRAIRWSSWALFAMGLGQMGVHIQTMIQFGSPPDERARAVILAMNDYPAPDFPIERTIPSRYLGYSLMMAATSLLIVALVLVAVSALRDDVAALHRVARIHPAGLLVMTVISVNYFIWPPTIVLLVSFGLAAFALAGFRKVA